MPERGWFERTQRPVPRTADVHRQDEAAARAAGGTQGPHDPRRALTAADAVRLQRAAGNGAVRALVQPDPAAVAVQRHSAADAKEEPDEEVAVQRAGGFLGAEDAEKLKILTKEEKILHKLKSKMEKKSDDTAKVNFLKDHYSLDKVTYKLFVKPNADPHVHAATSGGKGEGKDGADRDIKVEVNTAYFQRQMSGSIQDFNKLAHTLFHEYMHVEQRSKAGWRGTNDEAAKAEREFMAYTSELLRAGWHGLATMSPHWIEKTMTEAMKWYKKIPRAKRAEYAERLAEVTKIRQDAKEFGAKWDREGTDKKI
jgi:hypothetical protein